MLKTARIILTPFPQDDLIVLADRLYVDMSAPPHTAQPMSAEALNYPEQLPVTAQRQTLLHALRENQVLVVAGETGSGKTTQLPKMLLELGLHGAGMIGHTQPRRIAARSVAERLAEELGSRIGETIGYQVRFTAEVSEDTSVKLMTDGILLAELQRDPELRKYSAIIIDEAHERSLNIDVILGYLKNLLPKRPDLKVLVTSATIDPQRFSEHFGDAPIIEVSGRTYPVEIRYRPVQDPDAEQPEQSERDELTALSDAVLELAEEPDGDILVFFPASARSAKPPMPCPTRSPATAGCRAQRFCRCSAGSLWRSRSGSSIPADDVASYWPPMWLRRH